MPELLALAGLILMALLPFAFFRRGRLNLAWWLTAAPFFISGMALVPDALHPTRSLRPLTSITEGLSVAASALAIGLLLAARAAHRVPISLWHQARTPEDLVTRGPYEAIRHPFYSAFLLLLVASALASPGLLTAGSLAWGLAAITVTAVAEERQILGSELGERYREYLSRTGRFLPRLRRPS